MIRFFVKWWARWAYVLKKEHEGAMHEWSAKVAENNAAVTREAIAQTTREADVMEARIKEVAEMEEKGFWLCENGHEEGGAAPFIECDECRKKPGSPDLCADCLYRQDQDKGPFPCTQCGGRNRYIRRDLMTGQEKYESDKDRADAEQLVAARRESIAGQEKDLENQEATAKYFRGQAASSRALAENLRKV